MIFRKFFLMEAAGGAPAGGGGAGAGGAPAGGSPGAGGAPAGGGSPGGAGGGAPADWMSGLTDEFKGIAQIKGWKDPGSVIDAYKNLEKLRGVPAERLLTLPEKLDDPTAMADVFKRLGRPEKADGYEVKVPVGLGDDKFAGWAKGVFHELGLTKKQGDALAQKWNEYTESGLKAKTAEYNLKAQEQEIALKGKWGVNHDKNVNTAARVAAEFGLDGAKIDALETVLGYDGVMEFLYNVGAKMSESSFVTPPKGGGSSFQGNMSSEQAVHEIAALRKDSGFIAKWSAGDKEARERFNLLHKIAYPENAV